MSKPNDSAIRHQVIFDLKHGKGSAEADRFLKDGWRILTSIPAVRNFEVLKQVSPKNDYTYGFSMEFASQADYDSYNGHPAHVAFVTERWETEVTRFLEIDFVRGTDAEEGQGDAN
ncbi:Dabb family protein [Cohnella sp. GCM10012308]|uniref:Dabb family protein n=1 Tax=Cohnella sp. GCM10012308 TaxID=3317329 RepID=UPI00360F4231